MVTALYLMANLPLKTWIRLIVWLAIGMVIYFTYSTKHSKVQGAQAAVPVPALKGGDD
jgi:APA family basic amino acid/polyamine antiporter